MFGKYYPSHLVWDGSTIIIKYLKYFVKNISHDQNISHDLLYCHVYWSELQKRKPYKE